MGTSEDEKGISDLDDTPIMASSLRKSDVCWGDEFRAAYDQAKRHWPAGTVTYAALAERVSKLVPVSHTAILRLGSLREPPGTPARKQLAYLSLMALGFEPAEFGFEPRDRALHGMTDSEIRRILDPGADFRGGGGSGGSGGCAIAS